MTHSYWKKFKKKTQEEGIRWAIGFIFLRLPERILDEFMILNKKNILLSEDENDLVDLPSHSIKSNRRIWNHWDWSEGGEEWTYDSQKYKDLDPIEWKTNLINKTLLKYIKNGSTALEIGPGGGRWTKELQKYVKNLLIADISKKCLDICKERFKSKNNIEYNLIDKRLDFIDDNTIDFVWSYDVFVHINPTDVENYLEDIQRILKLGGIAIIHHSGTFPLYKGNKDAWRAYLGRKKFANMVTKNRMEIIVQNETLVYLPGDVITVFTKQTAEK